MNDWGRDDEHDWMASIERALEASRSGGTGDPWAPGAGATDTDDPDAGPSANGGHRGPRDDDAEAPASASAAEPNGAGPAPSDPGPEPQPAPAIPRRPLSSLEDVELRAAVESAVRAGILRASAHPGSDRLETEIQQLRASMQELGRRLQGTVRGATAEVWDDMRAFAEELRSRVDDIDEQQRRALRDLAEWQENVEELLTQLREELSQAGRRRGRRRDEFSR